jgi:hypothetical protein
VSWNRKETDPLRTIQRQLLQLKNVRLLYSLSLRKADVITNNTLFTAVKTTLCTLEMTTAA